MAQADIIKDALAASLKRLLEKESIEKISVDRICEECRIGRSSFYRYFQDKYELLTWIIETEFFRSLEIDPNKTIWDYYPSFIKYIYDSRKFFKNSISYDGQNSLRKYLLDRWYPIIVNDFGDVFPYKYWEQFCVKWYVYMSQDAYIQWLTQKEPIPWEEFMQEQVDAMAGFIQGVKNSFDKFENTTI